MMNYIEIDGVRSTYKLKFDKLPLFPMAARKTETYNVGRDETASYMLDEYEDIDVTLTAYMIGNTTILDVYKWISGGKMLTMSTQPSIYAKIKKVGKIQPERTGWNAHKIVIPITLSPFKYSLDNPEMELENGKHIHNYGSIYSRPIWTLYNVQSPVVLEVNGERLTINAEGGETVVIDTERMVVYSGVTVILDKTTGNLPFLNIGDNLISWTGDVERVTIRKNERWI